MEMTTYSTGDLAKRLGETKSSAGRHVKRLEQYSGPVTRNVRGQFRLTEQEVTWVEATRKMVSEGNVSSYADAYDVLLAEKVRAETAVKPEPDTLAITLPSDPFNGHAMNPREGHAVPLSGSNGDAKTVTNEPANGTKKSSEKQIERTLNDLSQRLTNWWTVIRREVFLPLQAAPAACSALSKNKYICTHCTRVLKGEFHGQRRSICAPFWHLTL